MPRDFVSGQWICSLLQGEQLLKEYFYRLICQRCARVKTTASTEKAAVELGLASDVRHWLCLTLTMISNLFLYLTWNITLCSITATSIISPFALPLVVIFWLCFYEVDLYFRFQVYVKLSSIFLCARLISFILMSILHTTVNDRTLSIFPFKYANHLSHTPYFIYLYAYN